MSPEAPIGWGCPKCRANNMSARVPVGGTLECAGCHAQFTITAMGNGTMQIAAKLPQSGGGVHLPPEVKPDMSKRQADEPSGERFLEHLRKVAFGPKEPAAPLVAKMQEPDVAVSVSEEPSWSAK